MLKELQLLSYYLTVTEIFNILKIRYPLSSSEEVLKMLEENNLITNYFDSSIFKEATNYIKNRENIPLHQSMNHYTTNQKNW